MTTLEEHRNQLIVFMILNHRFLYIDSDWSDSFSLDLMHFLEIQTFFAIKLNDLPYQRPCLNPGRHSKCISFDQYYQEFHYISY